jgi:hypothetical protein
MAGHHSAALREGGEMENAPRPCYVCMLLRSRFQLPGSVRSWQTLGGTTRHVRALGLRGHARAGAVGNIRCVDVGAQRARQGRRPARKKAKHSLIEGRTRHEDRG